MLFCYNYRIFTPKRRGWQTRCTRYVEPIHIFNTPPYRAHHKGRHHRRIEYSNSILWFYGLMASDVIIGWQHSGCPYSYNLNCIAERCVVKISINLPITMHHKHRHSAGMRGRACWKRALCTYVASLWIQRERGDDTTSLLVWVCLKWTQILGQQLWQAVDVSHSAEE